LHGKSCFILKKKLVPGCITLTLRILEKFAKLNQIGAKVQKLKSKSEKKIEKKRRK
jgi:outer membrane murein-binding lipoprotein Lpp